MSWIITLRSDPTWDNALRNFGAGSLRDGSQRQAVVLYHSMLCPAAKARWVVAEVSPPRVVRVLSEKEMEL